MNIQQPPLELLRREIARRTRDRIQRYQKYGLLSIGLGQLVTYLMPTSSSVKEIGEIFNAATIGIGIKWGTEPAKIAGFAIMTIGCSYGALSGNPELVFTVAAIAISSLLSGFGSSFINPTGPEFEIEARLLSELGELPEEAPIVNRNQRSVDPLDLV